MRLRGGGDEDRSQDEEGREQQLGGGGTPPTSAGDNPDAPPDLFAAFQQQPGLRLLPTKAPVDVMVFRSNGAAFGEPGQVLFRRHDRVLMTI